MALSCSHEFVVALDEPVQAVASTAKDARGKVIPMPKGLLSLLSRPPTNKYDGGKMAPFECFTTARHMLVQFPTPENDGSQVVQTIEATSPSCAVFMDQDTLVTGSGDSLVHI